MDMGRPKKNDYPPYMIPDRRRGGFLVRNPITGKQKSIRDEDKARRAAEALGKWVESQRQIDKFDAGLPTIGALVDEWKRNKLQFRPWDETTRQNVLSKMHRIQREIGDRPIKRTDCMFLEDWMHSFCRTADQWNKWRYAFILLWRYAVSRKLADACEPEKIEARSTSKKLAINRKVRRQLDIEGFWAIHEQAPPWLQLAMEQSLITLQARNEICNMRHDHYRDGHLFVIRDKVSGDSDMAFIKIRITDELESIRKRALALDGIASPFLIHRAPDRRRREWTENKPHWTYVNPDYLSKAFAEARDQIERFAAMPPRQRPTFHEIRGLGSRIYRAQGVPKAAIKALMTHSNPKTTEIYLERGAAALTDDDYVPVTATLKLEDLR